ncbi:MAG: Ig-like domain-containing protein [Paludibacteraceae bacterium]|nr:Ig-like domain-containing protein [Paludibacteraceae bacterium]
MKNTLRLVVALLLMLMSTLSAKAVETQVFHTDFTNSTQNSTFTIAKGEFGTSVPAWASSMSAYFHTTGSAGLVTISGVEFNNGGRIEIKWGSPSSRPLVAEIDGGKVIDRVKLESSERNTLLSESYDIETSVTGTKNVTFKSSGGGDVYFFEITIYTNAKGPVVKNFTYDGYAADAIDVTAGTIHVTVPYSYDADKVVLPVFELESGTNFVTPTDATTGRNFSTAQVYNFTDGSETKAYTVTVEHAPASTTKTLTGVSFDIDGQARTATISGNTVTLKLPFSYSDGKPNANKRKTVQTTFTYSDDLASAALSNSTAVTSGTALTVDYTAVTSIAVKAEDGSVNTYNFAIEYEPASTACDLLTLELPLNAGGSVAATIDQVAKTATATMTTANFNSGMVPTVITSPLSTYSTSSTNYSSPVTFTVTAEDGTTSKEYVLTIYKDDTKPTVTITSPADGAEGVSLAGKINLTFTETDNSGNPGIVKLGTGKVHITGGSIDQDLTAVMTGDNTATVAFSGLESLTTYTLTIATDAFTDNVGNKLAAAVTSTFKTADGTLHTVDLPYISKMDADNFAQPAFITGNYDATVSTMGATTDQFGAYKLAPGESLTLTAESAGTLDAILYAKAAGSYSISDGTQTITGSFSSYDNNGNEESLVINSSTTTTITITNTGSTTDIYVPYISVSADGTAITEKAAHCN